MRHTTLAPALEETNQDSPPEEKEVTSTETETTVTDTAAEKTDPESKEETGTETPPEEGGEKNPNGEEEGSNPEDASTDPEEPDADTDTGEEETKPEIPIEEAEQILGVEDDKLGEANQEMSNDTATKIIEEAKAEEEAALEAFVIRSRGIYRALESAADIIATDETLTQTEAKLLNVIANMAVVGDPVMTGQDVLPAMESYVGEKPPVELIREKANRFYNLAQKALKKL